MGTLESASLNSRTTIPVNPSNLGSFQMSRVSIREFYGDYETEEIRRGCPGVPAWVTILTDLYRELCDRPRDHASANCFGCDGIPYINVLWGYIDRILWKISSWFSRRSIQFHHRLGSHKRTCIPTLGFSVLIVSLQLSAECNMPRFISATCQQMKACVRNKPRIPVQYRSTETLQASKCCGVKFQKDQRLAKVHVDRRPLK